MVVAVVAAAVPELVALDSYHSTLWTNSDLMSYSQVGRNLHDVVGVVVSPHSWGMSVLIDEISNLACESGPFLPSLDQQL
jgi:hypothetical protein